MRKYILILVACVITLTSAAQINYTKLSSHLSQRVRQMTTSKQKSPASSILALMKLNTNGNIQHISSQYDVQIVDSIGAIYIVRLPLQSVPALSCDADVLRIEAERMPRLAMEVTPSQINATDVYSGYGLPQAFTGQGVAAGVFDCGFDFTHPAFLDAEGNLRVCYYYDFLWRNEDGQLGHSLETTEEIASYGHSQHVNSSIHGTHVMGIMAGSAVDGKYQGMAPGADIYVADFNSQRDDFSNPDEETSAVAVLGFKYIFDKAGKDGKPCVINFSSCESITLTRQRTLEAEALMLLTGPGRIIVSAAGNDGFRLGYFEKSADDFHAGTGIINGVGSGQIIDIDLVTPANQQVRFDFLGIKLAGGNIEGTITFRTDSVDSLQGDTCHLTTNVSFGEVKLDIYKSKYDDPRGQVYHINGHMPHLAYLVLCGATVLLSGDSPAWMYSDVFYSPFTNINGLEAYSHALPGYNVSWPSTLPGIIAVGATGYKNTVSNLSGQEYTDMLSFAPDKQGHITQFSSCGPTFDNRIKPDVVAPGLNINAAYNSAVELTDALKKELTDMVVYDGKTFYYTAQSGTSMASPVVAGTIALWLEANPNLSPDDILDIIAHTSTHPEEQMDYPNNTYGHGQIDAYRGLLYILNNNGIEGLSTHQPARARFMLHDRLLSVVVDDQLPDSGKARITVYTTQGERVCTARGNNIDLSNLPSGIYAIQFDSGKSETTGSTLIRIK